MSDAARNRRDVFVSLIVAEFKYNGKKMREEGKVTE
jgi:hypothetical protein